MENCIASAAYLAAQAVENGGAISFAEETAIRVCKGGGAEDINVFIIPSMVFVCAKVGSRRQSEFRRIYKNDLNLGRLEELNNISRRMCGETHCDYEIEYSYSRALRIAAIALATGAFCIYFGGTLADSAFAALIGNIICFIPYRKTDFNIFSKTLIESTAAAFLAFVPRIAGFSVHPDMIMTGTVMLLIPGMSIGGAMQDMMNGNLIAGILQITQAVVIAFAIVLGFAAALAVFG